MNTKHTQGPWFIDPHNAMVQLGEDCGYSYIADCEVNDLEYVQQRANAALISAAPEMFEVLEMLANTVVDSADDKVKGLILLTFINMSKAAINKARGE